MEAGLRDGSNWNRSGPLEGSGLRQQSPFKFNSPAASLSERIASFAGNTAHHRTLYSEALVPSPIWRHQLEVCSGWYAGAVGGDRGDY